MKRIEFKHMLMGLAVLMTSSMSAQDLLNYSVIHHAGMSIEIHDTVVDPATGFTIEDYLDMLGYDSDEAEIIEITDEMDFVSDESGIFFVHEEETENGHSSQTFEILLDDLDHNVFITENEFSHELKFDWECEEGSNEVFMIRDIDTENMELPEGEQIIIRELKMDGNHPGDVDVNVEKIVDEEGNVEMVITVDGEEIVMDVHENPFDEEMKNEMEKVIQEMDVQIEKIIHEESGEVETLMWINGEEVDPEEHEDLFIEELEIPEGAEFIVLTEGEMAQEAFFGEDINMTLALVSPADDADVMPDKSMEIPQDIQENIENVKFNSLGGDQYQLSFNSIEPAQTNVVLYDLQGREVYSKSLGQFEGQFNESLPLDLSVGAYVLNIVQNGQRVVKKIIVQ